MTEAEAKKKWCPFIKGENGDAESEAGCLGSNCMAWRKRVALFDRRTNEVALPGAPDASLEPRYDGHGFCGLAGAPQ